MSKTVTGEDFLADFAALSAFGAVPGTSGVDRQAGTAADGQQRRWFAELLTAHGFSVHRDPVGNLFGLLEMVPGAGYVLTGSHLDSQPTAGRYDGAYGVLASAHACFRIADQWRRGGRSPALNLAVVDWFNEEGSRFKPSMMGSAVFTGKLPAAQALATTDHTGTTVEQALDQLGERGDLSDLPVESYAEIHVQQGRSMEEDGITIGLVDATWAAHKYEFEVLGEQAHTGSALMADRRDALLGGAMLVVAARELTDRYPAGVLHTSVGELTVYPNSPVVVASNVRLLLDLRSPDAQVIADADRRLAERITEIESTAQVRIRQIGSHAWEVNPYQPGGVKLARAVAADLGHPHAEVMTVAGHDSTNMKDLVPTVMLFVPSVAGISHNVAEYTTDADVLAGLDVLTGVVGRLTDGELRATDSAG